MKLGIIGCGNMAYAISSGAYKKGIFKKGDITAFDKMGEKAKTFNTEFGASVASDYSRLLEKSDMVLVAVKPQDLSDCLLKIKDYLKGKSIISICAGKSLDFIEDIIGKDASIIRVNPNTPAMVGEGVSAVSFNKNVSQKDRDFVIELFSAVGIAFEMAEDKMNAITALAGSAPAFVFMAIEAMADAGVYLGLPRDVAIKLSCQTFYGASKLVKETGEHPALLKDKVASPGGTTIEGIFALEASSFRAAIMDAVIAAKNKADDM